MQRCLYASKVQEIYIYIIEIRTIISNEAFLFILIEEFMKKTFDTKRMINK